MARGGARALEWGPPPAPKISSMTKSIGFGKAERFFDFVYRGTTARLKFDIWIKRITPNSAEDQKYQGHDRLVLSPFNWPSPTGVARSAPIGNTKFSKMTL
jgi:hypothetical protein